MKRKNFIIALLAMLWSFSLSVNAQVAKIGEQSYDTFAEALEAANAKTGDVTVEVLSDVEFVDGMELSGSYTAINFIGTNNAKMTINQTAGGDYLTAHGKTVTFTDLTLAKANPAWAGNSGHMGNYFSIQGGTATYTNCTFPNGACTSGGTATYNDCTFQNSSEYGLWVYDDALVTVSGGTFDSKKGVKVYSEDEASVTSTLKIQNATFTENVTAKPAVAVVYAQSITLIGNTYNNPTVHVELDSSSDADCEGITFVAQDSEGNDISSTMKVVDRSNSNAACGVLVGDKIYTTVAEAAKDAKAGDEVTLLYNTTETVTLPEGVTLDTNGFTAENVTVTLPAVAKVGTTEYTSITAAIAASQTGSGKAVTIYAGTFDEEIKIDNLQKNLIITGAANHGTILTGGITIGTDDNKGDAYSVNITGIHFQDKGLKLVELYQLYVASNKFTDINGDAITIIGDQLTGLCYVTENTISGTTGAGINFRNPLQISLEKNDVSNTGHNSITIQQGDYQLKDGAIEIKDNTLSDWAQGESGEGRAMRIALGAADNVEKRVTISGNVMSHSGTPTEEFVKITAEAPKATVAVDGNYWNGKSPIDANVYLMSGTVESGKYPANYYADAAKSSLVNIVYAAKIGEAYYATLADAIAAIGAGDVVIELLTDATFDYNARDAYGTAETTSVTINGNGKTLTLNQKNSDWASIGLASGKLVLNNMTIEKIGYGDTNGAWNTHAIIFSCPLEMTDVTVNQSMAVQAGATLTNVNINEANGYYGLWINGNGQAVTMNGGSIVATNGGRGIKVADQYIDAPAQVTLNVTGTKFTTAEKAAVLVTSTAGAKIAASNVDITEVAADNQNMVWVDEDRAANYGNVEVTGANVSQEAAESFVAAITEGDAVKSYFKTLQEALDAVKDGETITLVDNVTISAATAGYTDGTYTDGVRYTGDKSFTVDFNGKTVTDDGCVNDYLIYINNKGEKASEITFTNGTIVSANGCWSAVCVNGSAATQNVELNLNGMKITNSNDAAYSGNLVVRARDLATVNVNDGTIITSNGASYGVAANTDGSTVNINEGATIVQQNSGTTGGNSVFAAVGGKGVINIKGGTITSDRYGVHTMTTGTPVINISGGTITAPVALKSSTNGGNGELATINVTGGTINGTLETYTDNGKIVVSGGTFSEAVAEEYCADGFVPVENTDGTFGVEKAPVASINGTKYTSLAEAVAAVEDGGTITLIANETFTENNRYNNGGWWDGLGYSGDKSFTIDLANFTISQDGALNDYLMWFKNDGAKANTITLKNGTLDAGTTAFSALATASSNAQKITVNLENIKVINNNSNGATLKIRAGAELNVKAGTEITGKDSYLGIECWAATVNIYDDAKFYMNGTSSYNGCLAGVSGNGTINVYGGEGLGKSGGFIAMTSGGTINIEGGEWTANTDGTYANGNKSVLVAQSENGAKSIVNVTGGTFKGGYNCYGNAAGDAQINIKGGNFNANPSNYVAEGYLAVENNGVWNVVKAAAKIGDAEYATLAKAVEAATAGQTIKMIADVELTETVTVPAGANITLDLNGKQIKSSDITITVLGELTVIDNTEAGKIISTHATGNEVVAVKEGGKFTLESGNIEGASYGVYLYTSGGTAIINGGTITLGGDYKDGMTVAVGSDKCSLTVTGGTFTANGVNYPMYTWSENTIELKGGMFDFNPNLQYIAKGYAVEAVTDKEGWFKVVFVEPMIAIQGGESFYTLSDAFAAAKENDVISISKAGEYIWPSTAIPAGVTVKATVEGVVATSDGTTTINATTLTVENVDFKAVNKAAFVGNGKAKNLTFTDCSFTGLYAFHVDAAAAGAELNFNNCEFNGFTTFATTVEKINVEGGKVNDAFIVRQDANINGVEFSEDAVIQLGTTDAVTGKDIVIEDCTVADTNGDGTVKQVLDIFNGADDIDDTNSVVVNGEVISGAVENVRPENITITINQYGSGTYCSEWALDFSGVEGFKAYAATGYNPSGVITLTRQNTARPKTGLFIKGTPGATYTIPVLESTDDFTVNMLVGTLEDTYLTPTSTDGVYANLLYSASEGKFLRAREDGQAYCSKNRAYLQIPVAWLSSTSSSKGIKAVFDDEETTGINEIEINGLDGTVYDLQGRRVVNPAKGMYIINGKKVFIK